MPIIRYFQHLIKPLFFNTQGRFISHVIAFALDLSYFVWNIEVFVFTATHLAHIIPYSLSMKPVNRIHQFELFSDFNSLAGYPSIAILSFLLEFNQMASHLICFACARHIIYQRGRGGRSARSRARAA